MSQLLATRSIKSYRGVALRWSQQFLTVLLVSKSGWLIVSLSLLRSERNGLVTRSGRRSRPAYFAGDAPSDESWYGASIYLVASSCAPCVLSFVLTARRYSFRARSRCLVMS